MICAKSHRCFYFGIYVSFIYPVCFPIILLLSLILSFLSLTHTHTHYTTMCPNHTQKHICTHTRLPLICTHTLQYSVSDSHTYTHTHTYHCAEFMHTYTSYYSVFDSDAYIHARICICTPCCLIHINHLFVYIPFYFASSAYIYIYTHYTTVNLIHTHILIS